MNTSFIKGTSITLITRVANLGIGIVISIILARLLGPDGRGIYALAILVPSLAVIFSSFGITSSTVYYLGKNKYSPQQIAGNNITITILLSLLAVLVSVVLLIPLGTTFFKGVPLYAFIMVICSIPFIKLTNIISNTLLGIHDYYKYNIVNILSVVFQFFVFIILLLTSAFTLQSAIITYLLSSIFVFVVSLIILKKTIGILSFKINIDYLKDSFNYGLKAYLGSIISFLHLRIDQLIINYFINPLAVGYYAIAVGLTERLWLLSESSSVILLPKISSETNEEAKKTFTPILCRNILLLTLVSATLLFFLGKWIILLFYSNEFIEAVLPFQILLLGTIFVSGSKILANDIAGRGKPIINTYINAISVFVNVTLNILLIPQCGIAGAAYATTISYTIIFIIRLFVYAKISNNKLNDVIFIKIQDFQIYKNLLKSIALKLKK